MEKRFTEFIGLEKSIRCLLFECGRCKCLHDAIVAAIGRATDRRDDHIM